MGRSKKTKILKKPWCWYCDRVFSDMKVLVDHQKAKHFRCTHCPKRFNSVPALVLHERDIHKCTMTRVLNANPGTDRIDLEIYGMEGVPEEDIQKHKDKLYAEIIAKRDESSDSSSDSDNTPVAHPLLAQLFPSQPAPRAQIPVVHAVTQNVQLPAHQSGISINFQPKPGTIQQSQTGASAQAQSNVVYIYTDIEEQAEEKRLRSLMSVHG
ncbi:putative Protein SUPPRESSOR OF FRI 4 [Blattamonas nauphoetae]|uniref:C2H2-type domain-containing protein n=1 Tax=Blattamonas nauphoetae TaxID=2049346 RepID=A0ABQ9YHT7_9EUKA|nr:putative Protein SUPPRESSOR OF FRI 4 [Blattamonas nauphoetae]